jgi:hypothetical protein
MSESSPMETLSMTNTSLHLCDCVWKSEESANEVKQDTCEKKESTFEGHGYMYIAKING